jgi:predicted O-linked N-acetylglucosamine transferase (SPINDLY family)
MDYILADAVVAPSSHQGFYSEAIVQLPGSFFPAGPHRALPLAPGREEAGLPESGFVFCCFNQNWKITEEIFDIWMRLLAAVDKSVLWLAACPAEPRRKLEQEAEARGIAASRLIWAEKTTFNQHLARLQLADLVLDTLPYNAHATAADALLAGVPVVTCRGMSFAGRVAASLLAAAGLEELVTDSLADYEALALRLSQDPKALAASKETLAQNRSGLFDLARHVQGLETAYRHMRAAADRKMEPAPFAVGADGVTEPV